MSSSRRIPSRAPTYRLRESPTRRESLVAELASSFVESFTDPSPIAQEALARDLAEISEPGTDEDEERDSDEEADEDADPSPYLYRRPSGIAFGTARPALAAGPVEDAALTKVEKKQARDEERSLLRDNHLLPPKHPVVEKPGLIKHLYKRVFSTKVPLPGRDEETEGSAGPTEESPLLQPVDSSTFITDNELLDEQFEAAVAAGQIKTTWQREAKTITVYSRSLITTFMLQYSISIASIFAVGHIGKLELGAVSCK